MPIKRLTDRNDTYTTTDQDEAVYGLKGNDSITIKGVFYDQESDATYISVYGGAGDDQIISQSSASGQMTYGGSGNDTISIRAGGDATLAVAYGGPGNDTLTCISSAGDLCALIGGAGQDRLVSQTEADTLFRGGLGKDVQVGGPESRDQFFFAKGETIAGAQRDTISGFKQGQDYIDLSPIDANTSEPDNQVFTFVASTNNPDIGQVSYFRSGSSTIVVADTGGTTFQIELKNFDEPMLATDFSL
jgi:Ca2+-binding RTX toxin-like protein